MYLFIYLFIPQGQRAKKIITEARINIATMIGASRSDDVIFTSGGTEVHDIFVNLL